MSLHWDTNLTPWNWERDPGFVASLGERRKGDRRKADQPTDVAEDPMVTLMAVTLDEVYAAMKPAKASLR